MLNINILHRDFYYIGGAERVAIAFVKYFQISNASVHLITRRITRDFFEICRTYDILPARLKIISLRNSTPLSKSIYSSLEDTFLLNHMKQCLISRQSKPIVTINTKFNEVLVAADLCYIHYPTCIVLKKNPQDPSLLGPVLGKNYMSSKFLSLYIKPFIEICYDLMIRELSRCRVILFNSNFTLHIFKKYVDLKILQKIKDRIRVVHPPIINNVRRVYVEDKHEKKYIVVRFKPLSSCPPEIWSNIIAEIAKNFKETTIVVMGFAKSYVEWFYITYLSKLMKKLGLHNINILVNASEYIKDLIFQKTKVYVHLIPYEHFGIMPLEALLYGANIVVHKMSGVSLDIHLKEPYVVRYKEYPFDLKELIDAISLGYGSENPPPELIKDIYNQHSFDSFKNAIDEIMKNLVFIG